MLTLLREFFLGKKVTQDVTAREQKIALAEKQIAKLRPSAARSTPPPTVRKNTYIPTTQETTRTDENGFLETVGTMAAIASLVSDDSSSSSNDSNYSPDNSSSGFDGGFGGGGFSGGGSGGSWDDSSSSSSDYSSNDSSYDSSSSSYDSSDSSSSSSDW